MIWVAAAGVVMNGAIALLLMRGHRDINLRSALLHEIGDTLSTAAVIAGGIAIALTGQRWIDPALSVGIGVMILWSSIGIIRESLNILLEGTPRGVDLDGIQECICTIPGVDAVHDLHVWSIGSDTHSLSCHVSICDMPASQSAAILQAIRDELNRRYHIHHTTIQFELAVCGVADGSLSLAAPFTSMNTDRGTPIESLARLRHRNIGSHACCHSWLLAC